MVYCMGSVHSSYTAQTAVDLQCTLHYTAGTLHFGLGLMVNLGYLSRIHSVTWAGKWRASAWVLMTPENGFKKAREHEVKNAREQRSWEQKTIEFREHWEFSWGADKKCPRNPEARKIFVKGARIFKPPMQRLNELLLMLFGPLWRRAFLVLYPSSSSPKT